MSRMQAVVLAISFVLAVKDGRPDEPAKGPQSQKPPWQRLLQGEDAKKAEEEYKRLLQLLEAGKFENSLKVAEAMVKLRNKLQGADHWQTVNARWQVEAIHRVMRQTKEVQTAYARSIPLVNQAEALNRKSRYKEAQPLFEKALVDRRKALGEEHPYTAHRYNWAGFNLHAQGKYKEAGPLYLKALAICLKVLGEEHPDTAGTYHHLAYNLDHQDKYAEAEPIYRKALTICRKVLGEEHADTARTYNNLAYNLNAQGKYAEAEPDYRKALTIRRKVLGEEHPSTATSYDNLAGNLDHQGKHAEAEPGRRKALAIYRKVLGEEHPDSATSYNNLAYNLNAQGKYAEAEPDYRKALTIRRKVLGEEHPSTATSYDNLAGNLDHQGKHAEAEPGRRTALTMRRKLLGEEDLATAIGYDNLAYNLKKQGKYAEAEPLNRKALTIFRKVLGEEHPETAISYNNVAGMVNAQGKFKEAEQGYRKALAIKRKMLGEEHPSTAASYDNLASNQNAQGKYAEAEALWLSAANVFATARLHIASSGLERAAKTSESSPLPCLAAVLARNGKPEEAWQRFEESLGRGTWDDLSARLRRPADEQAKQIELANRLNRLDQLIEKTLSPKGDPAELKKQRDELLTRRRQMQEELDALVQHLEKDYGPVAGQVFKRQQIQAALPPDTALIGWLDLSGASKAADPNGEHWAVLLRATGGPLWLRLQGSGDKNAWTVADSKLPAELRTALQSPRGDWRPLAQRLAELRLKPLAKHLDGVRRLIVLPSTALAGVPVEVIAEDYTVSYAPSATLYAHLHKQPKLTSKGLLALADPVFETPHLVDKPLPLPPGGILLTMVVPRSNAARAGLKPNDVLLRYNGSDLHGPADLKPLPAAKDADKRVAVTVWRDGETFEKQLHPGKLGVVAASEPAPQALNEQRRLDRRLASATRGDSWQQLPGTRAEVEALRRLFSDPSPKLLTDSQASEQRLYELATSGELGRYRFLHLATHGEVDDRMPLRSAVILSRDALPDPQKQLDAGQPVYDGQLTALEVLRLWHLNSELVTLSACQTALGKYERGEGFVGFAQSLILCGSRSVCLSLWKVDDTATALLMERFYQNLLGQREGLNAAMAKAAALAEAKAWLRGLSREEAMKRAARLSNGVARGKARKMQPLLPAVPADKDDRPYAHPYYWAAFVLMGDPD